MLLFTRRGALALAAAFALAAFAPSSLGAEAEQSRAVGWIIGDNLSLAALFHANGDEVSAKKYLDQARGVAANLGLQVPDLPPAGASEDDTASAVIEYLVKGDAHALGLQLAKQYGIDAGTLFDVAVKSNLLILLYEPGEDNGIGQLVSSRLDGLVPKDIWSPLIDAIAAKKSPEDIQSAVFAMHKAVGDYLTGAAG